ncbi:MAG: prolipoprotein diacylglyceryl transferase [Patescibacteria group bacterium]|nr:prolipoprotein diacylglyceryl transferase [Patescibacteria group bacterium]MDD4304551.1 prolipoprotein diacylglyceryl transferase [Patescibacteria group bacterium]MDD4695659.1 prolipoprotein diacylglyceryl transferase [Patescibacteria group bacterium]
MININPNPIFFEIGFVRIYWYGLIMISAIITGICVIIKISKNKSYDLDKLWDLFFYLILFGVIGARLYQVLFFNWNYYQNNFLEIFSIWNGGMAIQGTIIACIITLFVYSKKHKLYFLEYADLLVVALPLGQAIGRWGNFFNSELYGRVSNFPWAIYIKSTGNFHQPLFFYESILDLILFFILLHIYKKSLHYGYVFYFYIFGYGIIRFFMEFLRIDNTPTIYNIRLPQIISAVFVIISGFLLYLTKKNKSSIINSYK